MNSKRVAIDGPAGSGKSSISRIVSNRLGFTHLDTGAMYRALTLFGIREKFDFENDDDYKKLIDNVKIDQKEEITFLNGEDVSLEIRTSEVTNKTHYTAKNPLVRDYMKFLQREIAKKGNIILDGRDIGTNVLPDAEVKIYLTASIEERANRRYHENLKNNINTPLEYLIEEIKQRDFSDENRVHAPLKRAEDAVLLDTSNLSFEEVINQVVKIIESK